MKKPTLLLLLLLATLFSCKNEEGKNLNTQELNDQKLLDSIKKAYQVHYDKMNIPPNDSIGKIRKPPYAHPNFIGLADFCFDKERLFVHKILFSKGEQDNRFEGFTMYGKSIERASDSIINSFTIKQSLIYALVYPEFSSQTCSGYYNYDDFNDFILPYFRSGPEGFHISKRQMKLLKRNTDSVSYYISECYLQKDAIPITVYNVIKNLNLYQCIPLLIETFNKKSNTLILTALINLMFEDKYPPFFESNIFKEMKGDGKFYKGRIWDLNGLDTSEKKIKEILTIAKNYYQWKLQE